MNKTKDNTSGSLLKELLLAGITSNQYLAKIVENVQKLKDDGEGKGGKEKEGGYLKSALQGFVQGKVQQRVESKAPKVTQPTSPPPPPAPTKPRQSPNLTYRESTEELQIAGGKNSAIVATPKKIAEIGVGQDAQSKAWKWIFEGSNKPTIKQPKPAATPTPKAGAGAAAEGAELGTGMQQMMGALGKAGGIAAAVAAVVAVAVKTWQKGLDTVFPGQGFVGDNMSSYNQSVSSGVNLSKDLSSWAVYYPIGGISKGIW